MKYFPMARAVKGNIPLVSLDIAIPIRTNGLINFQFIKGIEKAELPPLGVWTEMHFEAGHFIDRQRNTLVEKILKKNPEGYLMFIDSDIRINPHTVKRMLLRAEGEGYGVQSGIYMSKKPPYAWQVFEADRLGDLSHMFPKMTDIYEVMGTSFVIGAAGAGCLMIRKDIFDHLEKPYFKTEYTSRGFISEDIYFFNQLRQSGISLYCDGDVVTHCDGYNEYPDLFWDSYLSEGAETVRLKESESLLNKKHHDLN